MKSMEDQVVEDEAGYQDDENMADIKKLKSVGICTIKGIQMTTRRALCNIKGLSEAKVEKIKEAAGKLLMNGFQTASEYSMKRKQVFHITTGSLEFDRPDRLKDIADRFNVDHEAVLDNVLYARAYTSEHQMELLDFVAAKFHEEGGVFKLLANSIMALFRVDFSGRGELAERQQKLAQMLSRLQKISEEYNVAVFVTNQMTADPGAGMTVWLHTENPEALVQEAGRSELTFELAMDQRDSAPESWEEDDVEAQADTELQSAFTGLNVNAPEFVPSFAPRASPHSTGSHGPDPVTNMEISEPVAAVENGETDTATAESWDEKGEADEIEAGGGAMGESRSVKEEAQDEMMEEDEEMPAPKLPPPLPDAPKKEHVNVVFIGHVDAGKSTIGGQIMYLTGMVDKRTLEKYEREAKEKNRETWYLSWALDTNQEERDKGKTVEVGRAYFETEKKHFTILDAPGHKSFVPNMIGGASQADLAVLVISARKGEFETGFEKGGQTREHAMLAKTAGVKHLIVLINKMDDPTVNWSLDRYEECKEKLVPFLKKVGFNPKKDIHFMPCSGLTGANLKEPSEMCPWYTGLPFIPHLDSLSNFNRSSDGPIRLPIVDKYRDMGTVVLGKLESGTISKAQQLIMMPNRHTVEVLSLLSDDVETDDAGPGENLKLRLKGIEEEEILPGFILCNAENLCHSGRTFDAQIVIIEHKSIICPGYNAVLHIHTCIEEVQITALICLVDKKTGEKSKTRPRFVKQDQVCIARLRTAGTICLETFKDFPQMGRFTLRDEGKTIAIGKVLKLVPEKD
ncbi:Eukaryotic peptide chain release factor GTP-binding subunit ERF3A [Bagarius yarrelli]|uniref:Eukaryotic peptide chain release factor GTP-binding subunit ERF3A n=1 Tax=Bagarius yarrelli TaxID=175774 RepID=A0A556TIW7_BAGYA|nr:Eukaryotic peptide chain release factor GTP-binding subunit ERF3A [Bagarius yarrelli]